MDPNAYLAIAAILVTLGVLGTVLPVLPGVLLVFGGLFLAAWAQDHRVEIQRARDAFDRAKEPAATRPPARPGPR